MSNIGTKTVRNNHQASGKSRRAPGSSDRKWPSSHHLPCSISRTLIPTSTAQYTGFFIFIDLMTEALLGTGREGKKTAWDWVKILKSLFFFFFFFKLPLRLCQRRASTNARSAPQSPPPPPGALLAARRRKAHREGEAPLPVNTLFTLRVQPANRQRCF